MQILNAIFLALIFVVLVFVAVLLTTAIYGNFKSGLQVRNNLYDRVRLIRLKSMLMKSGIDINRFIHLQSVSELENQIRNCESCENTEVCDTEMALDNFDAHELDYCPNKEVIITFKNMPAN